MSDSLLALTSPDLAEILETERGELCASGYNTLYAFTMAPDEDIDDGWQSGVAYQVRVSLRYLNAGTDPIEIVYTANGTATTTTTLVTKTNTNKWKWVHLVLPTNVLFGTSLFDSPAGDFSIQSVSELCVSSLKIERLVDDAEVQWTPNLGALATHGESIIDDTLPAAKFTTSIQSDNYVSGVSGWKIYRATGSAEFNDILARGTITATAGVIANWNIGTVDAYTISADNGKIKLNSLTPSITLGNAVASDRTGFANGSGIWQGKYGANDWRWRVGDPANMGWFESEAGNVLVTEGDIEIESESNEGNFAAWDNEIFSVYGKIVALSGQFAKWDIGVVDAYTFSADNGKVKFNSQTPYISLGNLVNGYLDGKGFWVGKHAGDWKFHIGDPAGQVLYWNGRNLYDTGEKIGGTVGGIDVAADKIYLGGGNFNNTDTPFYADNTGRMSLSNKLSWDLTTLAITGAITATSGTIGGWTINAATIAKTGIILDSTADSIYVGSGTPRIVIDGANKYIRTSTYTSGLQGFTLDGATGDAEFNNIVARGALRSSVFLYNALLVSAGTRGTFKSGAKVRADAVIPTAPTYGTTTVSLDVDDQDGLTHAASQLFATNDILRLKEGLVGDTWLKVSSASDQTTFWRYTCIIMAGTANVTYRKGLGVADYGLTGQGFIIETADAANSPYIQMATHAATFSSSDSAGTLTVTPQMRIGNLNGAYGFSANTYGVGIGQYGAASKTAITLEQTNGLRIFNNTTMVGQWDISGNVSIGVNRILLQSDGDVFVGSNITNPATTALAIFNNNQTYGDDSVLAGEIIIGNPLDADQLGNILITDTAMNFRVGTDVISQISIAGISTERGFGFAPVSFSLGSGNIDLDDGGNNVTQALGTSYIHITSASGDFTIRSVCVPTIYGHNLVIQNHSAHRMTIEDNGTPVSGDYDNIRTGIGANIYKAAGGICRLIYNNPDTRWEVETTSVGWTS